jgi:hypothetical protein
MKTFWIVVLISLQVLLGAATGTADTIIYDLRNGANTYWGGTVQPPSHPNVDVIGPAGSYAWDVTRMEITDTGTKIQVKIVGPWFNGFAGSDPFYNTGDLYLSSTGWHTTTNSPHYPTDTFLQSEGWNYVVTHRRPLYNVAGGFIGYGTGVYELDWNTINYSFSSLGRIDQGYYGGYGDQVADATITYYVDTLHPIDETNESYALYEFDKFLSGDIGFHFTMYCGNDVIEGESHIVPEPGTMLLLGFGLAGLAACGRRKK